MKHISELVKYFDGQEVFDEACYNAIILAIDSIAYFEDIRVSLTLPCMKGNKYYLDVADVISKEMVLEGGLRILGVADTAIKKEVFNNSYPEDLFSLYDDLRHYKSMYSNNFVSYLLTDKDNNTYLVLVGKPIYPSDDDTKNALTSVVRSFTE